MDLSAQLATEPGVEPDRTPVARSRRTAKPRSILETTDELVAAVPWGNWRSVLVYRRQHAGRMWVRLRTFNRHRAKGCWYPSPRFFVVPLDCAAGLAKAIDSAAKGEAFGELPGWYAEFESQYKARGGQSGTVPTD
ncbi:MAG: hypothetical protein AABZ47_18920 [Planctomycetota bacterium]